MKTNTCSIITTIAFVLTCVTLKQNAQGASTEASCSMQVVQVLSLEKTSDLSFGAASPGAPALTVAARSEKTAGNAAFKVTGDSNRAYTIALPADMKMTMASSEGSADREIAVTGFKSFPANSGTLDAQGSSELIVGATRAALRPGQAIGAYVGVFTVSVVY